MESKFGCGSLGSEMQPPLVGSDRQYSDTAEHAAVWAVDITTSPDSPDNNGERYKRYADQVRSAFNLDHTDAVDEQIVQDHLESLELLGKIADGQIAIEDIPRRDLEDAKKDGRAVVRQVMKEAQAEHRLWTETGTDPKTALNNEVGLMRWMKARYESCRLRQRKQATTTAKQDPADRRENPATKNGPEIEAQRRKVRLLSVDSLYFKWLNEVLGYDNADHAIIEAGVEMKERQRASDGAITARLGGDEYIVGMINKTDAEWDLFVRDMVAMQTRKIAAGKYEALRDELNRAKADGKQIDIFLEQLPEIDGKPSKLKRWVTIDGQKFVDIRELNILCCGEASADELRSDQDYKALKTSADDVMHGVKTVYQGMAVYGRYGEKGTNA